MYPHQVLMEQNNLQDTDLSIEAKGYLKDFNTFIRAINMKQGKAEKAGKEFEMSENDTNKATLSPVISGIYFPIERGNYF